MNLEEFDDLIGQAGIINDMLMAREVPICFAMGLILHVNEVDSDKHLHASYLEFLEAYARACEEASIALPPSKANDSGDDEQSPEGDDEPLSPEERRALPLHVKIENTIPYLLQNCTNKSFLERFEHPKKHPVVGLYVLSNKKFF